MQPMLRDHHGRAGEAKIANLREVYAATALASLEWSELREQAVDRVAASGKVPALGLLLWKARYQLESKAYQEAHKKLAQAFLERYRSETADTAERCVDQALHEFLSPACSECNGARELIADDLRIECEACRGSGIKRYSDQERSRYMKVSMAKVRVLSGKLYWLACEMGTQERLVNGILVEELRGTESA